MGCTNGIDGIAPIGSTDTSPGVWSDRFCPLLASLLAQWDMPLMASLKAERCEVLLHDLTLVLFSDDRPKGGELLEDNSSSTGASASYERMGSFPLLQGTRYKARPLSCTSLPPRSRLFSTWARNRSFSCCRRST